MRFRFTRLRAPIGICVALLLAVMVAHIGSAARAGASAYSIQADAGSGDWPMYGHDIARTNFNPQETTMSAANVAQLVQRWQSPDLGSNGTPPSGAPSVAGGKVYVGSSNPSGDNFFAFDAATGAKQWSANIGYQDSCTNVGIGATPAISGSVVVEGGGDQAYYGLDANTGDILWRNAMDAGPAAFTWASPLIWNGRTYIGISSRCDNPGTRGELRALDLQSGVLLANRFFVPENDTGADIWNSPALSLDGNTLVVATGEDASPNDTAYNRSLVTLNPNSLDVLQSHREAEPGKDYDFGTTPLFFHDNLGRSLVGAVNKNGIMYTYVVNSLEKGALWARATGIRIGMMPAYDPTFGNGGTLFVVGAAGNLYALNPGTGNDRWPLPAQATGRGNMAIANGLIFLNNSGTLVILDEKDGHTIRTITPPASGPTFSGVAVANGFVYWLSGQRLNAWSFPEGYTPPPPQPSPTLVPAAIPGTASQTFPETGKTVTGIFLKYWKKNGGLAQQGYPISELMAEASMMDGKVYSVQYFERAVFEYHPEYPAPFDVLLSQLGTFHYQIKYPLGAPGQQPNTSPEAVYFEETKHHLGGKFLEYWKAHGGVTQQGYPISDEFVETSELNGKPYLVQYFERAVFELHPENQPPYDVLLSQLGTFQLNREKGH